MMQRRGDAKFSGQFLNIFLFGFILAAFAEFLGVSERSVSIGPHMEIEARCEGRKRRLIMRRRRRDERVTLVRRDAGKGTLNEGI